MFIERVVLDNFKRSEPGRANVRLEEGLAAFIGANGLRDVLPQTKPTA